MDTSDNISDGTPITAAPFTDTTAPAEASNLNYTNPISGDMQITLEWDDPDDIDFLHVEITHDQPGGTESVIVNKGFKTTDISGMLNGKNYVFTVKTVDFNDNISNGITLEVLPGPGLGNWTQGAPFTSGRVEHASVIYNGYLYIVGGQTGGAAYANDVQYTQIFPAGSFYLISEGIRRLSASLVGTMMCLSPLIAIVLARVIFNETLTVYVIMGGFLIISGILGIVLTESKSRIREITDHRSHTRQEEG